MDSPALTLQLVGFRVAALLLISAVHGFALAATAVLLGDRGPKHDGRLTLWPTGHIDLAGAAGLVVFGIGWSKPVAIDPRELRSGRPGVLLVILSGFAGLLVLAVLLELLAVSALTTLPHSSALTASAFLRSAAELSIWCALFSLVPIPPLAGGMALDAAGIGFPPKATWLSALLLLAAVASGVAQSLLRPVYAILSAFIPGG